MRTLTPIPPVGQGSRVKDQGRHPQSLHPSPFPLHPHDLPPSSFNLPPVCEGLTLLELIIVLAIFGGLLGALFVSFLAGRTSYTAMDAALQVQQESRRAFDAMVKELRGTTNIDTELTSSNQDTPAQGASRLNFQIDRGYNVSGCTPDAICWGNDTTNGGWVHYLRNGTQLLRCQSAGSDTVITDFSSCRVLANNVQTFTINYANASRTVTLRLAAQVTSQQLPGGSVSTGATPLQVQLRLRNTG